MSLVHPSNYRSGDLNNCPDSYSHRSSSNVNFPPQYDGDRYSGVQPWDDQQTSRNPYTSDELEQSEEPLWDLSSIFGDTVESDQYVSVIPTAESSRKDTKISTTIDSTFHPSRSRPPRRFKDPSHVGEWTGVHGHSTRTLKNGHTDVPTDGTEGRKFKVRFADEVKYSAFVPWDQPIAKRNHTEYCRMVEERRVKEKARRISRSSERSKGGYTWTSAATDTATLATVGALGYGAWQFGPSACSAIASGVGSLGSGIISLVGSAASGLFSGAGKSAVESLAATAVDGTLDVGGPNLISEITSGVG